LPRRTGSLAGRDKDLRFLAGAARHGLVEQGTLLARLAETEVGAELRVLIAARINRAFAQ
jgi:hypothetical protein